MSGNTGIMGMFSNLFNGGQPPAAQPAQPGTQTSPPGPGNIPPTAATGGATNSVTAPNGVLPTTGDQINKTPDPATPFAEYAELWKTAPTDPNAPASTGVFGELDPKKFMEVAGKMDFSKAITPDQLQKIQAGGEEGLRAFASAMNTVAQQTFAQAAFAATKITEQGLTKARETFVAELPTHIKRHQVSDNLRNTNPIFNNPAVAPLIQAMESQFTVKYPSATPTEITQMAQNYIASLGAAISPQAKPAAGEPGAGNKDQDWDAWMGS